MGKILITGASGNVGRYVAQYALENGQEITVAGTNPDRLTKMFKDRAEIVYFDFTDSATVIYGKNRKPKGCLAVSRRCTPPLRR